MLSAITVANEFIRLGREEGRFFTPMQLLKLVYIAHGWMYGFFNKPLIKDDIEAWKYGPVIPDLYHALKEYGSKTVPAEVSSFWNIFSNEDLTPEQKSVINFVYRKYGSLDGISLSMITHQTDTPWSLVFSHEGWGDKIPDSLIHQHYSQLSQKVLTTNE